MLVKMLVGPTIGQIENVRDDAAQALLATGQAVLPDGSNPIANPQRSPPGGYGTGPKPSAAPPKKQSVPGPKTGGIPPRTPSIDLGESLESRLPPYQKADPTKFPENTPPVDMGKNGDKEPGKTGGKNKKS